VQQVASLKAEITKNTDSLNLLEEHKHFLEELTPPDFLEQEKKNKEEHIKGQKSKWVEKQITVEEENCNFLYFQFSNQCVDPDEASYTTSAKYPGSKKSTLSGKRNINPKLYFENKFDDLVKKDPDAM
jgi:hypothetical protein